MCLWLDYRCGLSFVNCHWHWQKNPKSARLCVIIAQNSGYVKSSMGEIGRKLENDEDLTEEESAYIGDGPESVDSGFWDTEDKFMTPGLWWTVNHDIIRMPDYKDLLKGDSGFPHWEIVAKAQIREMKKHGRDLLDNIKKD